MSTALYINNLRCLHSLYIEHGNFNHTVLYLAGWQIVHIGVLSNLPQS